MIIGGHSILYSKDADADRAFLRDVLGLTHVDVGHGWLIFGLPPAEVAVHPGNANDEHELYLLCDDVEAFVAEMREQGVACAPVQDQGYGLFTHVTLPGGGKLGVYEPRHARPPAMRAQSTKVRVRKSTDKTARKKSAGRKKPARKKPARKRAPRKRPKKKTRPR